MYTQALKSGEQAPRERSEPLSESGQTFRSFRPINLTIGSYCHNMHHRQCLIKGKIAAVRAAPRNPGALNADWSELDFVHVLPERQREVSVRPCTSQQASSSRLRVRRNAKCFSAPRLFHHQAGAGTVEQW
jgi:hypothetical protein